MTGYAPIAAIVAALGITLLLNFGRRSARLGGVVLVLAGAAPLVVGRFPGVVDASNISPLLAAAALVATLLTGALAVAFVRLPWLAVLLGLLAGLRIPLNLADPSPTNHLVPLWLVVIAGLLALLWRSRRDGWPAPRLGPIGWALSAWVLLAAISLAWSSGQDQGAYTFVAFYASFGSLVAIVGSLDPREGLPRAAVTTQVVLMVLLALVAVYQVTAGHLFWNPELIDGNMRLGYVRANSLFWDASALGRFEGLALIVIVGLLALSRRRWSVGAAAVLCAIGFTGLVLSYSRSGLVMVVAGVVLVALVWRPRLAVLLAGTAVVGILAAAALTIAGTADLERLTSGRVSIAAEGLGAFESAPLIGVGLGGYPSSHTVVLGIAAELGVLGLVTFLTLLATIALAVLRPADPGSDRTFRLVAAIALAALLTHSMLDSGLFDDAATWVLIAILGVLAAPSAIPRGAAPAPEPAPGT